MGKITLSEKIKRAKDISARDYILNYSHGGINKFTTCLLMLFCIFPIIYNIIFNIYYNISFPNKEVMISDVFSYFDTWFYIVLVFGILMSFLVGYQFLSLHYRTKLKNVFRISWIKDRWLLFCLALLLIWSFFSALASPRSFLYSVFGAGSRRDGLLTFCIFAIIFLISFLPSEKQIKAICETLVAVGVITGFMVALGDDYAGVIFFKTQSIQNAIFANRNHYGYFLAICYPVLIGLIMQDKSKNLLLIAVRIAELWLLTNAMLISLCRSSFVAIIIGLVGWNIYVFWLQRSRWYYILIIDVLFVLFITVLNTDNTLLARLLQVGTEIKDAIDSGSQEEFDKVGSFRFALWRKGLECSFKKPIFGYGPDNLQFVTPIESIDKPHNELIEIAASLGYPALIFYLAGLIGHSVLFFKNIKKLSVLEITVFSSVGCYLASSIFGNVMFYTKPYFYMMLGFSYILLRRHTDIKPLFKSRTKKKKEPDIDAPASEDPQEKASGVMTQECVTPEETPKETTDNAVSV